MRDDSAAEEATSRRFRPPAEYRSTGSRWLARVPAHWKVRRLKYVGRSAFSSVDKHTIEGEVPVRLCNYTDVYYRDFVTPDLHFMPASATPEEVRRFGLRRGDVLLTKDSESWDDIAVPACVTEDLPGVLCGYHLAQVRPIAGEMDGRYLFRAMHAHGINDQLQVEAMGITRFGLPNSALRDAIVPVPPVPEQRAIAAFLDRETARIDALVARKTELVEKLSTQRAEEAARVVMRGCRGGVACESNRAAPWADKVPRSWEVARNWRLFRERDERGFPELPLLTVSIASGVTVREFSDEHIEQRAEDPSTSKRVLAGDVVFNKMRMWQGAVGVAPVDGLVSPDYTVARPLPGVEPAYFVALFRSPQYLAEIFRRSKGMVLDRNRLYWDEFKSIPSLVPPLDEQLEIVVALDRLRERHESLTGRVSAAVDRLREYRAALITAAVTGQIDVRDEVPHE